MFFFFFFKSQNKKETASLYSIAVFLKKKKINNIHDAAGRMLPANEPTFLLRQLQHTPNLNLDAC